MPLCWYGSAATPLDLDGLVDEIEVFRREGQASALVRGHLAERPRYIAELREVRRQPLLEQRLERHLVQQIERADDLAAVLGQLGDAREERRVRVDVRVRELARGPARVRLLGVQQGAVAELGPGAELGIQQAPAPRLGLRHAGQLPSVAERPRR